MICNCLVVALNAVWYARRTLAREKTLLVDTCAIQAAVQLRYRTSEFNRRLSGAWRRYAGLQTEWLET